MQFAASTEPLHASVVLGSFGATQGLTSDPVFNVEITHAADDKPVIYEKPLRYGKLAEIHHVFRGDPRQPPSVVSLVFALAVLATLPAIFVGVRKPPPYLHIHWSYVEVHCETNYMRSGSPSAAT